MSKIKSTMRRAIKGLPPKYRGKVHSNAHSHATSLIAGEFTPCAEYFSWKSEVPSGAVAVSWGRGWLAYYSPFELYQGKLFDTLDMA